MSEYQAIMVCPFAALGVRVEEGRLTGIDFLPASMQSMPAQGGVAQIICRQLAVYMQEPSVAFDVPLDLRGTPFQQRVWAAIRAIPVGQTISYAELAARVGSGPRAVANACGANPIPVIIPCHRVVASHGLGGFMGGKKSTALSIKSWLLEHERGESIRAG